MHRIYFLFISVPLLLCGKMVTGTNSEFWIIDNPSALVIYNQYEQRLTESERSVLSDFSAWRVLENDYVLSDQFTHTIKTDLNRKIYFIQISDNGEPVNKSRAGKINVIKRAKIQGDTVRITSSERLSLLKGEQRIKLLEGMLIERIFKYGNKTFGRDLSGNISGWIEGNGPAHWEIYLPDNSDLALKKQLFEKVDQTVKSYNTRLEKLFTFLNKQYDKSNRSPQWIGEESPVSLKYHLSPLDYQNRFSGSQSFLIQELSDLLYGSSYQIRTTDGQFVIIKSPE